MIWKTVIALTLLMQVSYAYAEPVDHRAQSVKKKVKESIYRLVNNGHGSGFIAKIKGKNYIISNAHVCDLTGSVRHMTAVDHVGKKHFVKILSKSPQTDLCILSAPKNSKALPIAEIATRNLEVFTVGYPLDKFMVVQSGRLKGYTHTHIKDTRSIKKCTQPKNLITTKKIPIRQKDGSTFWITDTLCKAHFRTFFTTIPVDGGFSGSPMLNYKGEVIGVITAKHGTVSWGLAIDLKTLKKYLGYKNK